MSTIEDLIHAVKEGDVERIRELAAHTNLDAQYEQFGTPLMLATAAQDQTVVRLLLDLGATPDPHHGPTLMTALHIAASNGASNIVETLLDAGASCDARDNQGWTPLMFSIQEKHLEITRLLLDAGSEVHATDSQGRTALMQAANVGNMQAAELLIQHGSDVNAICDWVTPLILAGSSGSVPMIDLLVAKGAEVDFLDLKEGYSALMMASLFGNADAVKRLLAVGADVNLETEWCVTARTMSQRGGHEAVESLLIEHGAKEPQPVPPPVTFPWGPVGDPMLCKKFQL
jgi:serine/threonine-protein phosphatase 6 regulatory ankyrin repeat subunit B